MRRRGKALFWMIIELVLALLLLSVLIGTILIRRAEKAKETSAEVAPVTYTQEEVDALLAKAMEDAKEQAADAANLREEELLGTIRDRLSEGQTVVETLRPFYPDRVVLVSDGTFHFVPIREDIKKCDYSVDNLAVLESGEFQYQTDGEVISYKGVDVSKFQGKIDWNKVAEDGVSFAIIRVGLRGYGSGKLVEDEQFETNIEGALRAGLKVGVYFFSQAINEEELLEEANFVLEKIAPYQVQCPVVYDVEKIAGADGRMNALSVEERTALTKLFCQTIEAAGYQPMIYHNTEMAVLMLDLGELEEYPKWYAYYSPNFYYPYAYDVWQYSEKGKVNGIPENVDLNISFGPIWK